MTKGEYWILDCVVEGGRALPVLAGDKLSLGIAFNRPVYWMPREELVETLYQLFFCGDLEYYRDEHADNPLLVSGQIPPTRRDVERMLVAPHKHRLGAYIYHLTPQGGARWERYAKPDWNRFIDVSIMSPHDPEVAEALLLDPRIQKRHIYATNAAMIEQYLLTPNPASPGSLVGTTQWATLASWEATYWKTLPQAFHVSYWFSRLEDEKLPPQEYERRSREYRSLMTWYSNPFDYE